MGVSASHHQHPTVLIYWPSSYSFSLNLQTTSRHLYSYPNLSHPLVLLRNLIYIFYIFFDPSLHFKYTLYHIYNSFERKTYRSLLVTLDLYIPLESFSRCSNRKKKCRCLRLLDTLKFNQNRMQQFLIGLNSKGQQQQQQMSPQRNDILLRKGQE